IGSALLNLISMARLRVWNPSREVAPRIDEEQDATAGAIAAAPKSVVAVHGAGGKVRGVWHNPILSREVRTSAYGKRVVLVRLASWAVFAAGAIVLAAQLRSNTAIESAIPPAAKPIVTLLVVGLILLNALAVTSLTNERDSRALDLLLVTDLSPKEIVF